MSKQDSADSLVRSDALLAAVDPFRRALAVLDALPGIPHRFDNQPLRDYLPGVWPTVADLRALVDAANAGGEA